MPAPERVLGAPVGLLRAGSVEETELARRLGLGLPAGGGRMRINWIFRRDFPTWLPSLPVVSEVFDNCDVASAPDGLVALKETVTPLGTEKCTMNGSGSF